ncbi:MAG: hypothetical protein HY000_30870 [Planctomycetes bacterium]|nr:hypothetical protein [Planctomycetota bacterium]
MNDATVRELMHEAIHAERRGQFAAACANLRQAITLAGDTMLALDARLRLGKLLVHTSAGTEADQVITEARRQAEQLGAPRQTAAAIHLRALLQRRRFRYDEARRLLDASPAKSAIDSPTSETGQYWHYRGLVIADQGELAQGERMLFRAHQVYQELQDKAGLAEVCDSLANLLLRRGKTRVALVFAEQSLKLKREAKDRYGEAITLGTNRLQVRYDDAARMFAEDLATARELGDTRVRSLAAV